jgi:hypothetical protein
MIREVKIICFYYLKSIYIKNLSSRIFILFWIDYGIWGDFFFFFVFLETNDWFNKISRVFPMCFGKQ